MKCSVEETCVKGRVGEWVKELNELSVLTKTEPQLAYAATYLTV